MHYASRQCQLLFEVKFENSILKITALILSHMGFPVGWPYSGVPLLDSKEFSRGRAYLRIPSFLLITQGIYLLAERGSLWPYV